MSVSKKDNDDKKVFFIFRFALIIITFTYDKLTNKKTRELLSLVSKRIDSVLGLYSEDKNLVSAFKNQKNRNRIISSLVFIPAISFAYSAWLFVSNNPYIYKYFVRTGTNIYNLSKVLYEGKNSVHFDLSLVRRLVEADGVDFAILTSFSLLSLLFIVSGLVIEKLILRNHVMITETMRVIPLITYFNLDKEGTPEFKKEIDKHWYIFKNKTVLFCHAGLLIDVDSSDIDSVLTDKHIWTQTSTYPIKSFQNSNNRHLGFILIGSPLADLYPMFTEVKVPKAGKSLSM